MSAGSSPPSATDFQRFAAERLAPHAEAWEEAQSIPRAVYTELAEAGYLGGPVDPQWGGGGWSAATMGEFCAAVGGVSMSLLSTLTVHHMAMAMIAQWGEPTLQRRCLPAMVRGDVLGAFGLTEPEVGSAAADVRSRATPTGEGYTFTGHKKWISGGTWADGFVVLGQCGEEGPAAFWIERARGGVSTRLITGMLGFRAAMNTEQRFDHCPVPADAMLGPPGGGFTFVFSSGLDLGRFIIAWGALGLMRACLTASATYAATREQFGRPLAEHALIRGHLAEMHTGYRAAEGLCRRAAERRDAGEPAAVMDTATAKYFASRTASRVADLAVQVHGAQGCGPELPVQRYFRDARITEIIEGSNEMQQLMLGQYAVTEYRERGSRPGRKPGAETT